MAELPPTITVTLDPAATASIADLADAATGLRHVMDRLEESIQEERRESKTLDANELNKTWAELSHSMPKELRDGLFDWLSSNPGGYVWDLFKIAQHYHWNR